MSISGRRLLDETADRQAAMDTLKQREVELGLARVEHSKLLKQLASYKEKYGILPDHMED